MNAAIAKNNKQRCQTASQLASGAQTEPDTSLAIKFTELANIFQGGVADTALRCVGIGDAPTICLKYAKIIGGKHKKKK